MTLQVQRRAFTVEEYHKMAEAGIFTEDDRVELLDGEIVQMAAIGARHAERVRVLGETLVVRCGLGAIVSSQNPVHLDERSEPQPDLAVLRRRSYSDAHPAPDDILLLIEVADTTADYDRRVKLPLYARASVRETWLVDLQADRLEVYRQPAGDGYHLIQIMVRGQRVSPERLPDITFAVDDILG